MTISTSSSKVVALGNGSTVVFSFNFLVPQSGEEQVIFTDANGVETILNNTQYALIGFGLPAGGTVTYPLSGPAIPTGTSLTIARVLPLVQGTTISNQGAFYPQVVEAALDYGMMVSQQLQQELNQTIQAPIVDPNPIGPLPTAAQRAGKYLAFDSSGNPIAAGVAGSVNSVTLLGSTSGSVLLNAQSVASGVLTVPNGNDTLIGRASTDTITGVKSFSNGTLVLLGSTSGSTLLQSTAIASGTLTLPAATDTLVGRATIDTLSSKSIDGLSNTITNVSLATGVTGILPIVNGGTNANAANGARLNLAAPVYVANIAALQALDVTKDAVAILEQAGRQGTFVWTSGNFSTQVTADTAQGIYIAPNSDLTGASGAWVRVYSGPASAAWFGTGQAAIQAAHAVVDDILIDTTFAITSTATWPNGKRYKFVGLGKLTIANAVTLTINGIVNAPIWANLPSSGPNTIFSITGTGAVVGLRRVWPEWWGAVGNGTTDDKTALQAAHDCVQGSFSSDGGRPEIVLRGGANYGLGSQFTIRPTANINLKMTGAGPIFAGSRFTALTSFSTASGTSAIRMDGNADATQQIASYDIGNFGIIAGTSTAAVQGFQIGGNGTTTTLIGEQQSSIHDIYISNFTDCWHFEACRLAMVERCSGWTTLASASACTIAASATTAFTGDLDFNNCQFVAPLGASSPSGSSVRLQSTAGGTCAVSGIGFTDCDFYGGQFQLNMNASGGGTISDIWVNPRCQFEGPVRGTVQTYAVNMLSSGTGSIIRNIHVSHTYMSGNGFYQAIEALVSTSGLISDLFIDGNFIANCVINSIDVRGTGGTVYGVQCNNNILHNAATGQMGMYFEAVTQINVIGNSADGTQGGTDFVRLNSACDWVTVIGNNPAGLFSGLPVNDTSTATHKNIIALGQITGTQTNDNANAGNVAEYLETNVASGSAISLTTGTAANVGSIVLTPGDWEVDMNLSFTGAATTTVNQLIGSLSLTSAALDGTVGRQMGLSFAGNTAFNQLSIINVALPPLRFSVAANTSVYAVARAGFGTSTCSVYGIIKARRAR